MRFYAYRLTGNPATDTAVLNRWGVDVTVTEENGELWVVVNDPTRFSTYGRYKTLTSPGRLVVFKTDDVNPLHVGFAKEITGSDEPYTDEPYEDELR